MGGSLLSLLLVIVIGVCSGLSVTVLLIHVCFWTYYVWKNTNNKHTDTKTNSKVFFCTLAIKEIWIWINKDIIDVEAKWIVDVYNIEEEKILLLDSLKWL